MKIFLSILLSIILTGCFETNPLIGKWTATKNVMLMKNIEFTKNKTIFQSIVTDAKYTIENNRVIVTDQFGIGTIYNIIDNDTISVNIPIVGTILYKRTQ